MRGAKTKLRKMAKIRGIKIDFNSLRIITIIGSAITVSNNLIQRISFLKIFTACYLPNFSIHIILPEYIDVNKYFRDAPSLD